MDMHTNNTEKYVTHFNILPYIINEVNFEMQKWASITLSIYTYVKRIVIRVEERKGNWNWNRSRVTVVTSRKCCVTVSDSVRVKITQRNWKTQMDHSEEIAQLIPSIAVVKFCVLNKWITQFGDRWNLFMPFSLCPQANPANWFLLALCRSPFFFCYAVL